MASAERHERLDKLARKFAEQIGRDPDTARGHITDEGDVSLVIDGIHLTLDDQDRWVLTEPGDGLDDMMVLDDALDVAWAGRVRRGDPDAN